MIGAKQIILGPQDFVRGMSTSPEAANGGFSPETNGVNLIAIPGVLNAPADVTDKSTNLTGNIIGYTPTNLATYNGFFIASDGKVMSIDASQALTASTALGGTYTTGTTDIVNFIDKIYITSANDVARINTDLSGGDATWWSSTLSKSTLTTGVRHPMVVFQDRLWVGSANSLHNIVDSSTGNKDVLVLNAHWEITALGVDPSSGKMLIACTQGANYSGTIASKNVVFSYDGTSATYTREYAVDGMVTGFRHVGGVTYAMFGGNKIGYWNGAGITFMRKLKNVTLAGADLPYKHHLSNIDNTLYVVDGMQILAYGEVLPGQKVWYYAVRNVINSNNFGLVCHVGDKKLGLGFASNKFYTFDTTSVATSTGSYSLYSNIYYFQRPIAIRSAHFEFYNSVASSSTVGAFYLIKIDGTVYTFTTDTASATNITNNNAAAVYELDTLSADQEVMYAKFNYDFAGSSVAGLRRIVIYYDDKIE